MVKYILSQDNIEEGIRRTEAKRKRMNKIIVRHIDTIWNEAFKRPKCDFEYIWNQAIEAASHSLIHLMHK